MSVQGDTVLWLVRSLHRFVALMAILADYRMNQISCVLS